MNLHTICLQFICVILVFNNCLTKSITVDKNETSYYYNLTTNLTSNSIDEINNIIENSTSANQQQQQQSLLLNSVKKPIDLNAAASTDNEQLLNALDVNEKFSDKTCNQTIEYKCKNDDKCIDKELVCDGFKDCPLLGDDELNCDQNCSLHNKFQCKSDNKCIDLIFKCNSFPDCAGK